MPCLLETLKDILYIFFVLYDKEGCSDTQTKKLTLTHERSSTAGNEMGGDG